MKRINGGFWVGRIKGGGGFMAKGLRRYLAARLGFCGRGFDEVVYTPLKPILKRLRGLKK